MLYLCRLVLATDFVNLFEEEDIRASQFEWWWDQMYVSYKFRDNEECRGSYSFMRADEMLLNAAEACARQGKEAEAKELLWQLQDMRIDFIGKAQGIVWRRLCIV